MEKSVNLLQTMLPNLVRSCSNWIQVDLSIKLFGVKVFSFTMPPQSETPKTEEK